MDPPLITLSTKSCIVVSGLRASPKLRVVVSFVYFDMSIGVRPGLLVTEAEGGGPAIVDVAVSGEGDVRDGVASGEGDVRDAMFD